MWKSFLRQRAHDLGDSLVARRLVESFFPAGRHLPAPDAQALTQQVADYCQHLPGLGLGLEAGLQWLEWQYFLQHGQRFSRASLAQRQSFLQQLTASSLAAPLLHALTIPYRAAYTLDEQNARRLSLHTRLRIPSQIERQRWQQQVTTVDQLDSVTELEADVVVIGTGAGGAAAAYELARHGCAVVVLEEGHYHDRRDFTGKLTEVIPKLYRASGATAAIGNTLIPIPVGKSVGGTTTINSGTCLRTPSAILQAWRDEGLSGLSDAALEPYFDRVEAMLRVQRADSKFVGEIGAVIQRGAEAMGMTQAHPLMRNAEGCDGQGLCQFGCPTDAKQSTNVSFMPRALESGAFLYTGVRAQRLLRDGQTVCGVEATGVNEQGEQRRLTVRAPHVIVAMGTFFTPLFLRENGVRNPWLGRNLSIHPAGVVTGRFPGRNFQNSNTIPQGFGVADLAAEGIMFEGGTPPFAAHGLLNPFVGPDFVDFTEHYQQTGYFGFMIKDSSRGTVRKGLHPDLPLIRYSLNAQDFDLFKRGVQQLGQMMLRAGAEYVHLPGLRRFPKIHSEQELATALAAVTRPHQLAISAYHPLGTARLGASAAHGVCDEQHRVFGWEGLYVMDGATVPSSLGANPQVTIMSLASRAAERLAEKIQNG